MPNTNDCIYLGTMAPDDDLKARMDNAEALGHKVVIYPRAWARSVGVYAETILTPPRVCECGTTSRQPSALSCSFCERDLPEHQR